jgi:hypothetical protein
MTLPMVRAYSAFPGQKTLLIEIGACESRSQASHGEGIDIIVRLQNATISSLSYAYGSQKCRVHSDFQPAF